MTATGRRLRLRIGDSSLDDVGEGRARVSRHLMEALDLDEGELLRILGPHPILAAAVASDRDDEGLDLIRLDATQRRRAGLAIGDVVEAERHAVPAAKHVRVMIVGHSGSYDLTAEDLRSELSSQPVMVGDSVAVAPKRTQFDIKVNVLGLTIADVNGTSTECGAVLARIVETHPPGVVQVAEETEIVVENGLTGSTDDSDG
jgi:hypothetical protein